jgi:hypothetical protein
VEHTPSCLIGNSHFSLDLLGRDTASGRSHAVDSLKPYSKRCRGLVKYRASSRVDLMPTIITLIAWATSNPMMFGYLVALGAVNTFRPTMGLNPFQTGFIGGELLVKIFSGILFHFSPHYKAYHKLYMLSRDNYLKLSRKKESY